MEGDAHPALEIRLVGQLTLSRAGAELPLPASRKSRALLGYLALSGKAETRDRLCEMFWEVPDDPRGSLRWNLSQLRKALGPEAHRLAAEGDRVSLNLAGAASDWHRMKQAADARFETDAAELEGLADLDGELLEGLDLPECDIYHSWLIAQREDWRRWRGALLQALAMRSDEPEARLAHARAWVELDRYSPGAWEALVSLLLASGRSNEAEQQRAIAVRRLEEAGEPVPRSLRYLDAAKAGSGAAPPPLSRQEVRFCRASDGTGLAYAVTGTGPPLVKTANWMGHLELDWQNPIWAPWLAMLSEGRRFVRYDERGNGLSDWNAGFSFEAFVDDLANVVDAAGLERFDVIGISQGAAVAVAYATAHPERVRRMVLFGGFAAGREGRASEEEKARREAMMTLTAQGWGAENPAFRQMFTSLLVPEASTEEQEAFNEMQRLATSPENCAAIQRVNYAIDVRDLLASVAVPTLVAHSRGDAMVPFEAGRALARGIPNARFLPLDSRNHMLLAREPAWEIFRDEVRAFLDAE
jgi:DNA-binding SARP family transcriptional activator/pimeloyl-ACP methyl ester carboxylesterase